MPKPIFRTSKDELARMGISDKVEPWEDGMRTDPGRGFYEWWYFDAHLNDGSTVVIVYLTKSFMAFNKPLEPGVMITITRPDGEKKEESLKYSPGDFSASRDSCNLRIGGNTVEGDLHHYKLNAEGESLKADLSFTGISPPWRPGDGKAFFGDKNHYFAWLPAIPYGTVEGTLTYDGKVHQVSGSGYHDHNWGNISLPRVMDHWYWGRARVKDFTLIFVEQITHRRYGSQRRPVFYLAHGDKVLTGDGDKLTLETDSFIKHSDGRQYPEKLDFHWESGGNRVHIALRNPKTIDSTSLLSKFPLWKQKLLGLIVNPYYFRFNGEMDLKIDFGNLKAHEKAACLYELMLLN